MIERLPYADQTILHPLGLAILVGLGLCLLLVRRDHTFLPLLALASFVSPAQRIAIFELDFNLLRIMVIIGFLRLLARGETRGFRLGDMDKLFLLFVAVGGCAATILHGTASHFIYVLGISFDAIGVYFLVRLLVRDWEDLEQAIRGMVLLSLPIAALFVVEKLTTRNYFSIFGGVDMYTSAREGKVRCQGAYPHAIIAGCFWASLLPLMAAGFWQAHRPYLTTAIGMSAVLVVVATTASSTPLAGVGAVAIGALFFPLRARMRWVTLAGFGLLAVLHLVMKAPVWHLISRIDLVGGSTGWHRYHLIDQAIRRFPEWWLLGTKSTAHWGFGLYDVTNQYVAVAVGGGLISLVLFLILIARAFVAIGRTTALVEHDPVRRALNWGLGVSLFSHVAMFLAVSYFGQIILLWYMTLAVTASLEAASRAPSPAPAFAGSRPPPELVTRAAAPARRP